MDGLATDVTDAGMGDSREEGTKEGSGTEDGTAGKDCSSEAAGEDVAVSYTVAVLKGSPARPLPLSSLGSATEGGLRVNRSAAVNLGRLSSLAGFSPKAGVDDNPPLPALTGDDWWPVKLLITGAELGLSPDFFSNKAMRFAARLGVD